MGLAELQVQVVQFSPGLLKKNKPRVGPRSPREIEDRPEPPDKNECSLFAVAEMAWAMLVITPLVVGQWRGCWSLMAFYTPETKEERFLWWSLVLGAGTGVVFALLRQPLTRTACSTKTLRQRVCLVVLSRIYIFLFALASIAFWRGLWELMDMHCGKIYQVCLFSIGLGGACLARLRSVRNLSGPPFIMVPDLKDTIFNFPIRFKTSGSKDPALHTLDCVFSVFVIGSLVVIVWRGTWGILDIILMPEDPNTSAWLSLAIGYGVTVVGFALQVPARIACDKLSGGPRLIVADLYQFLCFCGTVNLWRGIWNLLDIYLLPETPLVSFWVTHWVCLIVLMILNCGNSLLVRGVYIDGEEEGGQCVVFQVNYLRYHYKEKRKRQAAAQVQGHSGHSGTEKRKDMDVRGPPGAGPGLENHHVHVPLMTHTLRDTIL
ncbi:uncharacterized protein LOC132197087 isoform X1 [Neocloeon triangulifer]|uniref:uncharacterized protein LOC132197087 isoform X1 n=1 Tax=Neocloeon triangulifer TaxID=2078957 RepID=UPI00286F964F|nr:uncharacterized protein LOC132197087 isoform X1 [Neocloeon triangulifer]